ncbi:tRNA 2-thiouridine(34) synthase MnmA [Hyphomicrobium methylovorum]|uniref:tRNA 2-thiouridine(34) synthase MnmA n=1 Tax=Hyphomicrobium methylovorum TaxID=84 RepID=UPI0015E6F322|nr:tRNA 2-thiouridine(34) synthase MnmA [Hyphomicrobium methylovorum]MBA2127009.1 tRNA 2-thiouridine(34) synthase MnmA [Hyphomicrobium methylovorum]
MSETLTPIPPATTPKRVVVAMSGGVDSSVAAAIMKAAGHEVIGVTLQLYDHGSATQRKGACCAGQDIHDARRVAETLGIPHYVLDYEARFAAKVIETFAESYVNGETPIPCVTCNNEIKFHDLLDTAKELGAEILVTGHYVQRRDTPNGPELARAADPERDQSYFLFGITKEQLAALWFPIGGMQKADVRELARTFNLPVADKSDSQDICFVPTGRYTDVIERLKPSALDSGDIVHLDGRVLGRHDGIVHYTVGQRRGIKIPAPEPLYVVRLDAAKNEVIVGPRSALTTIGLELRNVNWLGENPFNASCDQGLSLFVRMRSSQSLRPAIVTSGPNRSATVALQDGEEGIATGQACVFYADASPGARVLGGGWIARTVKEAASQSSFRADDRMPAVEARS